MTPRSGALICCLARKSSQLSGIVQDYGVQSGERWEGETHRYLINARAGRRRKMNIFQYCTSYCTTYLLRFESGTSNMVALSAPEKQIIELQRTS
jgi:hypothetical protein